MPNDAKGIFYYVLIHTSLLPAPISHYKGVKRRRFGAFPMPKALILLYNFNNLSILLIIILLHTNDIVKVWGKNSVNLKKEGHLCLIM